MGIPHMIKNADLDSIPTGAAWLATASVFDARAQSILDSEEVRLAQEAAGRFVDQLLKTTAAFVAVDHEVGLAQAKANLVLDCRLALGTNMSIAYIATLAYKCSLEAKLLTDETIRYVDYEKGEDGSDVPVPHTLLLGEVRTKAVWGRMWDLLTSENQNRLYVMLGFLNTLTESTQAKYFAYATMGSPELRTALNKVREYAKQHEQRAIDVACGSAPNLLTAGFRLNKLKLDPRDMVETSGKLCAEFNLRDKGQLN